MLSVKFQKLQKMINFKNNNSLIGSNLSSEKAWISNIIIIRLSIAKQYDKKKIIYKLLADITVADFESILISKS